MFDATYGAAPCRAADTQGDISQARGQLGQLLYEFSQIELNRDLLEAIRRTESKTGGGQRAGRLRGRGRVRGGSSACRAIMWPPVRQALHLALSKC